MRNICIFVQWITKGKVCFGSCKEGLCKQKDHKLKTK